MIYDENKILESVMAELQEAKNKNLKTITLKNENIDYSFHKKILQCIKKKNFRVSNERLISQSDAMNDCTSIIEVQTKR